MYEPTPETEHSLHRAPTGEVTGVGAFTFRTLMGVLQGAAALIAGRLGYQPDTADIYRVGMPEALLLALKECGDPEAARLAAERFLDEFPRVCAPLSSPFGYYRGYYIEERRDEGGGWLVLEHQGGENIMPGGEWFRSTNAAALVIDLLYECGLIVDGAFVEMASKYAATPQLTHA